jgi:hypothetical protein
MKLPKAILIIPVSCLALFFGCETEPILFKGPYFVRFSDTTAVVRESNLETVKIEVHNAGYELNRDINVNYTISGTAREGIDFVVKGTRGKMKIDNNDFVGNIEIQLINNSNNILRSQFLVLTLESVDADHLKVGQGESDIGRSFTLTILDDCILGGTYYGSRASNMVPIEGITITSTDCEEYTLSNWDIEIFDFSEIRSLSFIDNGDNTITIPPQEEDTLPTELATIDGSGHVNPLTRQIIMTVRLVDFDEQPEITFTLTPN